MMKFMPIGAKPGYVTRVKKCCSDHPVITALVILLVAAAIAFTIVAIVKLAKREEGLLDDEWNLDDDEPLYFSSDEDDFVEVE